MLATVALLAACGPTLSIHHLDPAYPRVDIHLDRESVGTLEYGDEMSIRVDSGFHEVEAYPTGSEENPWADDGRGWIFFVDDEAQLTLLPAIPVAPAVSDE